jgi:hypothetical protein
MKTPLVTRMAVWIGRSYRKRKYVMFAYIGFQLPIIRLGAGRPVIPKRGEKDFEPSAGGGSGLQIHVLDRARSAMFDALKATPSTSR